MVDGRGVVIMVMGVGQNTRVALWRASCGQASHVPGHAFGFFGAQRASSQDATRPSDRLAIASVLLGGIVVGVVLVAQVGSDHPAVPRLFGAAATSQAPRVQSG